MLEMRTASTFFINVNIFIIFSTSPLFVQISMNVAATMEGVHTHAPTHPAHSSVAVELDTHWQGTEGAAMVSRLIEWDTCIQGSIT